MFKPESEIASNQDSKQITPEYLKELSTLEISVDGNFGEVLDRFNNGSGLNLQSRPDGYHVTIIGPAESKVLQTLTASQIEELQRMNDDIQKSIGVEVQGVGFIDGEKRENIRVADKSKKVLYAALDIQSMQDFRKSLGLRHKDLHVTMGFENGDIHMQILGKDAKGKDILRPIPKKADVNYQQYAGQLHDIKFGSLSGKEKEKPKE